VVDVIRELQRYGARVDVYDPWASARETAHEYGLQLIKTPRAGSYDAIVLAVAHSLFKQMGLKAIRRLAKRAHVVYDIKYLFEREQTDARL
jgi:UDP-N-acetyl-D-galactosamine dehydrogenase